MLRAGWALHRGLYRVSGGRIGIERPSATKLGTLRLHTRGRRSGEPRTSFLYYLEDGDALAITATVYLGSLMLGSIDMWTTAR